MGLFKFFRHAPYKDPIENPEKIQKMYPYWRLRVFYSIYIGYAFFYFTRKSFTFAMPAMMAELGFTKTDLGILGSILYMTYGVSKFLSGIMSDRSNPRYFMGIGLVLTGIFNILFGLSSSVLFFALFWGLNGWFQGWGWPPVARLLTHWYSQSERGTWWGLWNTSHNVGGAIIPIIVAAIAQSFGWRVAMYVPGSMCIVVGLFLINRLRDTPQSLGLPSVEHYRHELGKEDKIYADEDRRQKELTTKELLIEHVLKNRYIWTLGLAYFFVYIVRTAVNDWGQVFLYEQKGFSLVAAGTAVFCFEVGGFFGSLGAGWFSDKFFNGRRGPINALFALAVTAVVAGFWWTPVGSLVVALALMFAVGFFIFGPQMLIGVAAAELSHKQAAGTATGFIGWFAYFGAAAAGFPFGKIAQDWGWEAFFVVLTVCAIVSTLCLMPLWSTQKRLPEADSGIGSDEIGEEMAATIQEVSIGRTMGKRSAAGQEKKGSLGRAEKTY